jgi:hypothetical protein
MVSPHSSTKTTILSLVVSACLIALTQGFSVQYNHRQSAVLLSGSANKNENDTNEKDMDPLTKSSWYAVELFGKLFGSAKDEAQVVEDYSGPPKSLQETLNRIKLDNDRSYFLSGQVDEDIYDPECVFSDPFVSFAGRDRFVTNLANLGSFITNYSARVLDYDADDSTVVKTKVSTTTIII